MRRMEIAHKYLTGSLCGLLFLLAIACYANSLQGEFVYDDSHFITDNPYIKHISLLPLYFTKKEALSFSGHGIWRPLRTLSFALDYRLWRFNPFGYHLTNVLLHALNGMVLFSVLKLITNQLSVAFLASLIFICHPLQTESVAWISSRSEPLYALFFLLAFLWYLKDNLLLCLLFYFLSLLSKESAIVLPLVLLSFDCIWGEEGVKSRLKYYLCLFLIAIGYLSARFSVLGVFAQEGWWGQNLYHNFLTICKVLGSYLRLVIFPFNLRLLYEIPIATSILEPRVIFPFVSYALLATVAWRCRASFKILSFAILWFFINLLPVFPISRRYLSEHYLYLPLVGFAVLAGFLLCWLKERERGAFIASLAGALLILGFSFLTIRRNMVWHDSLSLWLDTMKKAPSNPKAYVELGTVFYKEGKFAKALDMYQEAIQRKSDDVEAHINASRALVGLGRFREAEEVAQKAVRIGPDFNKTYLILGVVYLEQGDFSRAVRWLEQAVRLNPDDAQAYYNLGMALDKGGRPDLAIPVYQKAVGLNPDFSLAYNNLGIAYARIGRLGQAREYWREALRIEPQNKAAQENLRRR